MSLLSNTQRDLIADLTEVEWVRRADNAHPHVKVGSTQYRQIECEYFIGAAGVLKLLAPTEAELSYIPIHWMTNPPQGRCVVEPYRIRRLSQAALVERAAKMMKGIIPSDEFGKALAASFVTDDKDTAFRDWVRTLPVGR